MKTKTQTHTPGPWEVVYNDAYVVTHPTGDRTYRYVATTDSQADSSTPIQLEDKQEDEANARLIAAAPDLYFIAEIALRWFDEKAKDDNFKGSFPTSLLRAAVAKAEGQ